MALAESRRQRSTPGGPPPSDELALAQAEFIWRLEDCANTQNRTVSLISIHVAVYAGIFGLLLAYWPTAGTPFPVMHVVFALAAPVIPFWLTGYVLAFEVINVISGYEGRLIERIIHRGNPVVINVEDGSASAAGGPTGSTTLPYPFTMHMTSALLSGSRGLPEFRLLMAIGGALNLLPLVGLLTIAGYQVIHVEEPARDVLIRIAWPVFAIYLLFLILALRVRWLSTHGGYRTWNRLMAKLEPELRRSLVERTHEGSPDEQGEAATAAVAVAVDNPGDPVDTAETLVRRPRSAPRPFRPRSVISYLVAPRRATGLVRGLWIVTAPSALVGLAASGNGTRWPATLVAVLGFELLYHGRYLANDLHGRNEDRTSPTKAEGGPLHQMAIAPTAIFLAIAARAAIWLGAMAAFGQLRAGLAIVAGVALVTCAYEATRNRRADGLPPRLRFGAYLTAFTGGYVLRCLVGFWIGAGFAWWPASPGFRCLLGLYMAATASALALLFVRLAVMPYLGAAMSVPTRAYLAALDAKQHLLHCARRNGLVDSRTQPTAATDRTLRDVAINVAPLPLASLRMVLFLLGLFGGAAVGVWLSDGALTALALVICIGAALAAGLVMALRTAQGAFWTALTLTILYIGVCGAAGLDRPWLGAVPILLNLFSHAMYRTSSLDEVS